MSNNGIESMLSRWASCSFDDCINLLDEHLNVLLERQYPTTTPSKIKNMIVEKLQNNEITSTHLSTAFDVITKFPGNLEITSLHYLESHFAARLYAEKLYANGESTKAFSVLTLSALNIGQLDELFANAHACVLPSYDDIRRKQTATLGAIKKNEGSKIAQGKLIELLIQKKPTHGWPSKSNAAAVLAKFLFEFTKANAPYLSETALPKTIERWMREDETVKAAILSTLKEKPSRS
ncbi:hypothetical protein [Pseudomonas yamanorum]|uniref:hypothetical protein n=1 Tax=Pseudomonas yamanorum TaxID=515393 RepID=UPI003BA0CC1E